MFWKPIIMASLVALLAGCSDRTSRVSGQVTLDGQPLVIGERQRGTVLFRPVGGGATTTAILDPSGVYTLKTGGASGIKPGEYLVAVRVVQIEPADESGEAPSGTPITPAIYADPLQSGLRFDVKSGRNRFDIDLDSTAGPVHELVLETPSEELEEHADEELESAAESPEQSQQPSDPADAGAPATEQPADEGRADGDEASAAMEPEPTRNQQAVEVAP